MDSLYQINLLQILACYMLVGGVPVAFLLTLCPHPPNPGLHPRLVPNSPLCPTKLHHTHLSAPPFFLTTPTTIKANIPPCNPITLPEPASSSSPVLRAGGPSRSVRGGEGAPDTFNPLSAQAIRLPRGGTPPGYNYSSPRPLSFTHAHSKHKNTYSSAVSGHVNVPGGTGI